LLHQLLGLPEELFLGISATCSVEPERSDM
jgi:hypothetical protein